MESIKTFFDKIVGALMSFSFPSDLLDVILVAFIIYEAIKLMRGSRTSQIIKGIGFLFVLYFIVRVLRMEASLFLLTTLFENGLIILVVLFSPELRKVLEKFGGQSIKGIPFLSFKSDEEYEKEVKEVVNDFCKSSVEMSESNTGALVVFEKRNSLKDIVETGTIVDAASSSELFNSLFFKNSALHDGAVVVRDGKIYAAGCILPLTQNRGLDSELGTRHRAAIGITEHSDAIAVVVSEENGYISFAKNGNLTRNVSSSELREMLLDELIDGSKSNKGRRQKENKDKEVNKVEEEK
jgi:diadenylate cyclase